MCHHPVSQGLSSWSFSHLRWQVWTWGMWLRSSPAIGTAASLHGRDLQALLVSICPRKWHLGHISMCPTVPALHQPSSLPFPLCLAGTQLCDPSSSSPSAGDALASSSSWLWSSWGTVTPVQRRRGAWSSGCSPHLLPTAPWVLLGHQARLSQPAGTPVS